MSRTKTHVKKGEEVEIITGNHKGKRGTVLSISGDRVVVEGAVPVKKATRPSEQDQEGGIKTIDGSVHISNVKKVG